MSAKKLDIFHMGLVVDIRNSVLCRPAFLRAIMRYAYAAFPINPSSRTPSNALLSRSLSLRARQTLERAKSSLFSKVEFTEEFVF